MEDKKENDRAAVNAGLLTPGKKSGVSFDIQRVKSDEYRMHACSPVREESADGDEEEFTEDLETLEKKLSRNYQKARHTPGSVRRQTLGTASARRTSLGGSRRPGSRRSFGGNANFEVHAMNELKDELRLREKLDHTRQHRLNAMDIKRREAENKLVALQSKYRDLKKEKDDIVRQNIELRKKNKQLAAGKRRLEEQKEQQERTIRALLAKVGEMRGRKKTSSARRPDSAKTKGPGSIASSTVSEEDEEFRDGEDVLANLQPPGSESSSNNRRYTMAPGELSRMHTKKLIVRESNTIRIDDLPKNSMSKDAANLCVEYGVVVHARVTKCVVSGELKGYLTFAEAASAREAVRQLRAKGHKVKLVEDS